MFDSSMRYDTDEFEKFQKIYDNLKLTNERLTINAPEFKFSIEAYDVYREWINAAMKFVAHIRDVYTYNLDQNHLSAEERRLAEQTQIQNQARTTLFAAQYILADHYLKSIFARDTDTYYSASGVYNELMESCPNLLRFGTQLLVELQQKK